MSSRTNDFPDGTGLLARALATGAVAGLASAAALALLARAEGRGAVQPINATSHWLHGDRAAACDTLDARHTLVGFATHYASAVFWALPFEIWRAWRGPSGAGALVRGACMTAAVAAAVDYGITPKRLTPGWELVLSRRALAATYAVLALGLVSGTKLAQALAGRRRKTPERQPAPSRPQPGLPASRPAMPRPSVHLRPRGSPAGGRSAAE